MIKYPIRGERNAHIIKIEHNDENNDISYIRCYTNNIIITHIDI